MAKQSPSETLDRLQAVRAYGQASYTLVTTQKRYEKAREAYVIASVNFNDCHTAVGELSWKEQMEVLMYSHGLIAHVDGSETTFRVPSTVDSNECLHRFVISDTNTKLVIMYKDTVVKEKLAYTPRGLERLSDYLMIILNKVSETPRGLEKLSDTIRYHDERT